jgi:hypothetical protein
MNNTHAFTKVILAAIGIFFSIRIISQMAMALGFLTTNPSLKSLGLAIVSLSITGFGLAVVCYLFLYKREELAKKIVGQKEPAEPAAQIQWLPAAFRLICIFAGLHCLYAVSWRLIYKLGQYSFYNRPGMYTAKIVNMEDVLYWLIMLTASVYLLCGAPHFVRWQVRKTIEQCKEQQVKVE